MNIFIILSILVIVIGVILLSTNPSVLFEFSWNKKTTKEKLLMFIFYSILIYAMNIIFWIIKQLTKFSVKNLQKYLEF